MAPRAHDPGRVLTAKKGPRAAWLALLVGAALGGCAKSPTVILTRVAVDDTVPTILLLHALITSDADPSKAQSASFLSLASGDASGVPGPYVFPLELPITAPPSLAGAVTVTIEGLDYVTRVVVARGAGLAQVVSEHQTTAAVIMTAVNGGGMDAGTDTATNVADGDNSDGTDGGAAASDVSSDL